MNFGYILRTLRISAGVSLRELARTIDVSPTYVSMVENGKLPPPNAVRIARIEEALKVPPGYLLAITCGFDSNVMLYIQDVPEVVDFLSLARQNSMTSADFMEITGFLNTYGWKRLKQVLETGKPQLDDAQNGSPLKPSAGPYLWPFLNERMIFEAGDVKEKTSFLKEAVSRISSQCDGVKPEIILEEFLKREKIASTGIGRGIAVPHAYISGLERMIVAFWRIPHGLDFVAVDGEPVYIAFMLAGPRSSKNLHLALLARIAKLLRHGSFSDSLLKASGPREIISMFKTAETKIP